MSSSTLGGGIHDVVRDLWKDKPLLIVVVVGVVVVGYILYKQNSSNFLAGGATTPPKGPGHAGHAHSIHHREPSNHGGGIPFPPTGDG